MRGKTNPSRLWEGTPPTEYLIENLYREAGLDSWTNDQVLRVCRLLNCTIHELCALAGIFDYPTRDRYYRRNKWPCTVALHFWKLQLFALNIKSPDEQDYAAAKVLNNGSLKNTGTARVDERPVKGDLHGDAAGTRRGDRNQKTSVEGR